MVLCNSRDRLVLTFSHLKSVVFMNTVSEAAYESVFSLHLSEIIQ